MNQDTLREYNRRITQLERDQRQRVLRDVVDTGSGSQAGPPGSLDQQFYPYLKARALNASDKTARKHETRWVEMARGLNRKEYYKRWDEVYHNFTPPVPPELVGVGVPVFEKVEVNGFFDWRATERFSLGVDPAPGDVVFWLGPDAPDWDVNNVDADGIQWQSIGNEFSETTPGTRYGVIEPRPLGSQTTPGFYQSVWSNSPGGPGTIYAHAVTDSSPITGQVLSSGTFYTANTILLVVRGLLSNATEFPVGDIHVYGLREHNYLSINNGNTVYNYNRHYRGIADWDGLNVDPVDFTDPNLLGGSKLAGQSPLLLSVDVAFRTHAVNNVAADLQSPFYWIDGANNLKKKVVSQQDQGFTGGGGTHRMRSLAYSSRIINRNDPDQATRFVDIPENEAFIEATLAGVNNQENIYTIEISLAEGYAADDYGDVAEGTVPATSLPDKLVVSLPPVAVPHYDEDKATARRILRQRYNAQPAVALESVPPGQEGWFAFEGYAWALVYLHDWRHRWAGYPKSSTRERTLATPDQLEIGSTGKLLTGYVGPRNRKGSNPTGLKDYLPRPEFLYSTSGPNVARIVWAPGDDPSLVFGDYLEQTLTVSIAVASEQGTIDGITSTRNLAGPPPALAYTLSEGDRKATGDVRQQWPPLVVPHFLPFTRTTDYGTWTLNEFHEWTYTIDNELLAGEADGTVEDTITLAAYTDLNGDGDPTRHYGVYSPFMLIDPASTDWPEPWVLRGMTDNDDGALQPGTAFDSETETYVLHDYGFDPGLGRVPGSVTAKQDDDYRAGFRLCLVRIDGQLTGGDCC